MVNSDLLSIVIVVTVGLFFGTTLGLVIGYLTKQQQGDWHTLTGRQQRINAGLVIGCSALCIAGFALYAFR